MSIFMSIFHRIQMEAFLQVITCHKQTLTSHLNEKDCAQPYKTCQYRFCEQEPETFCCSSSPALH